VRNQAWATLPLDNEYLFNVGIYVGGALKGTLNIASDLLVSRFGRLELGELSGQVAIRLNWTNDRYIPGQLDANIRYESIEIIQTAP
jgi:hypothetical protein